MGGGGGQGIPGATLSSLSPSSVPAGSPPFTLTINGSGFVAEDRSVGMAQHLSDQYTFVSSTQVTDPDQREPDCESRQRLDRSHDSNSLTNPSNALTLTISPFTSSACVLFGLYDFFFTGFDSSGPVTIGGAFGVDANGNVSGEEDFKDLAGTRAAPAITGGSCTNSSTTNEGTLTVTTAAGTSTYSFATQGASRAGRPWPNGGIGEIPMEFRDREGSCSLHPATFSAGTMSLALVGQRLQRRPNGRFRPVYGH